MSSINDEQWTVQVNGEINGGETSSVLAGEWESEVNTELNKLTQTRSTESKQWKGTSIYRIPLSLRKLQRSAYQPQTVSIGPYHHGQPQLAAMEKHKQRAFLTFLARSKKSLRCYVDALAPVVEDLKDAYDQLQPKWKQDTEAFLKLMIVDGCFILEIMRTTSTKAEAPCRAAYSSNDPVFGDHGKIYLAPSIKRDMLMLENQLPLLLLNKLVIAEGSSLSKQDKLTTLILKFFKPRERRSSNIQPLRNCLHILHLYRESLLNKVDNNQRKRSSRICQLLHKFCHKEAEDDSIRSATELTDAGIRFELSKTRYLNDITFRHGVLRLPQIIVDDAAESQYLNLMALERLHVGLGNEVTSYVYFMDNIIDSAKDVSLLHWQGIIQSSLGSDKAVASMFNSLSREACIDERSHLSRVQQDVADYCRLPVPKWMAYAKHTYFTNPWVSLSIVAAIFLFALTIIQTVYAILDYHKKDPETIRRLP